MRITCDRCGKDRMLNEVHTPARQRAMSLRDLILHLADISEIVPQTE